MSFSQQHTVGTLWWSNITGKSTNLSMMFRFVNDNLPGISPASHVWLPWYKSYYTGIPKWHLDFATRTAGNIWFFWGLWHVSEKSKKLKNQYIFRRWVVIHGRHHDIPQKCHIWEPTDDGSPMDYMGVNVCTTYVWTKDQRDTCWVSNVLTLWWGSVGYVTPRNIPRWWNRIETQTKQKLLMKQDRARTSEEFTKDFSTSNKEFDHVGTHDANKQCPKSHSKSSQPAGHRHCSSRCGGRQRPEAPAECLWSWADGGSVVDLEALCPNGPTVCPGDSHENTMG